MIGCTFYSENDKNNDLARITNISLLFWQHPGSSTKKGHLDEQEICVWNDIKHERARISRKQ